MICILPFLCGGAKTMFEALSLLKRKSELDFDDANKWSLILL